MCRHVRTLVEQRIRGVGAVSVNKNRHLCTHKHLASAVSEFPTCARHCDGVHDRVCAKMPQRNCSDRTYFSTTALNARWSCARRTAVELEACRRLKLDRRIAYDASGRDKEDTSAPPLQGHKFLVCMRGNMAAAVRAKAVCSCQSKAPWR